jgi:hypothetical protein
MKTVLLSLLVLAACDQMKKTKPHEAELSLRKITSGAKTYFNEHAKFPAAAPTTPPEDSCCAGPNHKCAATPSQWAGAWEDLAFSMDDPHYCSYTFDSTPTTFTARATCNLDCDETLSTYEVSGMVQEGNVVVMPVKVQNPND